ncbi:hypothetical protein GH157_05800 [archaeon]|nr:hypothetical protein [archaeon]
MLSQDQIEKNIEWLRENGSAPVRYLTYLHLLGASPGSGEMRELWERVEEDPVSREIFSKQRDDGSWFSGGPWASKPSYVPKSGYTPVSPKYVTTSWILSILGEMGYDVGDERVKRACEYNLTYQWPNGVLAEKRGPSEEMGSDPDPRNAPCRMSIQLTGLAKVGIGRDPRLRKSFELLKRWAREDGGWVHEGHRDGTSAPYKIWDRSCPWSTYFATTSLFYSGDPSDEEAYRSGLDFLIWHLDRKPEHEIRRFFWHGHDTVRELLMFSEAGVEPTQRSVKAILDWLDGMCLPEEAYFRYVGKPVSRMSVREDGASTVVMKYRLFHLIEDDWLTYYVTRIASNFQTGKGT